MSGRTDMEFPWLLLVDRIGEAQAAEAFAALIDGGWTFYPAADMTQDMHQLCMVRLGWPVAAAAS